MDMVGKSHFYQMKRSYFHKIDYYSAQRPVNISSQGRNRVHDLIGMPVHACRIYPRSMSEDFHSFTMLYIINHFYGICQEKKKGNEQNNHRTNFLYIGKDCSKRENQALKYYLGLLYKYPTFRITLK